MCVGGGKGRMVSVQDLDELALEVLEAVYETGGEATTSEVKRYTGIDKNARIHYRFDKLEDAGLIEVGQGEAEGNRLPPKKAVLTDEAERQVEGGLFGDEEEPTIAERMNRLERRFEVLMDEFEEVRDEFRRWRYNEEEDREVDITELLDKMETLDDNLGGLTAEEVRAVMDVEGRMEALEDRFLIKGKWARHFPHVDSHDLKEGDKFPRVYPVDGYDIMMVAYSHLDVVPPVDDLPEHASVPDSAGLDE